MAPLIASCESLASSLGTSGLAAATDFRGCVAVIQHPLALAGLLLAVYVGLWSLRYRLGHRARQAIRPDPGRDGSWQRERISIIQLRTGSR